MRVLHIYRTYFPDTQGGLEEVIRQICVATKRHNVESRILTPSKNQPDVLVRDEAAVYRSKFTFEVASCTVSIEAFAKLKELARWADVLHYHFPWPFADLLHLSLGQGKPSVLTYHSDIVRQRLLMRFYAPLMRRFLSSVDRIVCTSPNYFATSDVLSNYESKVEVIPIGVDENTYPVANETIDRETEARYGEDFFLFVGVLRYYKGLHILLDAIQGAPYKVVIAGSGPTEKELKKQAQRLNLSNVEFTGYVSDEKKVSLFKLSRGIVFPSYLRSEAFGVTLLEGAMFGKPLVSTEVGSGTSHVNVDSETGYVVPPGSVKALRHALDQLYHRPDVARLMGRKARARYEKLFTGKRMGDNYYRLYETLTRSDSPAKDADIVRVIE